VPESGVMDVISAKLANSLLNNHLNDAVLEVTLMGPKVKFTKETCFVITGAGFNSKLNETSISNFKIYKAKKNDVLNFGNVTSGVRSYLAVKNGFQSETVLNSKSFYKNITSKFNLAASDSVNYLEYKDVFSVPNVDFKDSKSFFESEFLEVYKAPEFELFKPEQIEEIFKKKLTISNENSRMGYRLQEAILPHSHSITTSPVLPGTVQVVPSGNLIILMKDAQTTGGYPRIFQLTEKAIAILAQKSFGDKIQFKLI
jgi:biotin-dependent carboxylase-like uncharacterized protein